MLGLETALKLSQKFDVHRMQQDLQAIERWAMSLHRGSAHNGGWTGICLIGKGGQIDNIYDPKDELNKAPYQKTEVLNNCPYFNEIIDRFPGQKHRVRLLALLPGGKIYRHFDPGISLDSRIVRLHIPIVTSPKVKLVIGMQSYYWQAGELWYGDFEFPHWIHNNSSITRVHLVIDLPSTHDSLQLFKPQYIEQKKYRSIYRKLHQNIHENLDKIEKKSKSFFLK
jgi:quercetin dioxygenase-like cupin family protein